MCMKSETWVNTVLLDEARQMIKESPESEVIRLRNYTACVYMKEHVPEDISKGQFYITDLEVNEKEYSIYST